MKTPKNVFFSAGVATAVALIVPNAATAETLSAASYSREGLIAQWDGIENVGLGLPHDSTTNVWKDLVGSRDLPLVSGKGAFVDNALECLTRDKGWVTGAAEACTDYKTIEIVCDRAKGSWEFVFYSGSKTHVVAFSNTNIGGSEKAGYFSTSTNRATWAFFHPTGNAAACYENGEFRASATVDYFNPSGSGLAIGAPTENAADYRYTGKIYAIRLYDRMLTNDELLFHSRVDQARFFGVEIPVDIPEKRTLPDGTVQYRVTACAEGGGSVRVNGSSPVVSNMYWIAAKSTVTFEAVPKAGLMLAGWSEPGSAYVTANTVRKSSFSAVLTGATTLLASFEGCGSLRKARAADYVRDGLIAQWDGIENAGLGLPHDSATNVWKDLVGTRDLPLVEGRGSFDTNALVCANTTVSTYAAGPAPVISSPKTVEVVCDACPAQWSVPLYLSNPSQIMSMYSGMRFMYGNGTIWRYSRNWVVLSWVDGRYFADGCRAVSTQTYDYTWNKPLGQLVVGGDDHRDERYYGRIYSIRVYDRALTETERLHNYLLDCIRFDGVAVPPTSGTVLFLR